MHLPPWAQRWVEPKSIQKHPCSQVGSVHPTTPPTTKSPDEMAREDLLWVDTPVIGPISSISNNPRGQRGSWWWGERRLALNLKGV